jgi:hypothetical protein
MSERRLVQVEETPGPSKSDQRSRRAAILARVLAWVNEGRFENHESWMLFGARGTLQTQIGEEPVTALYNLNEPEHESVWRTLGETDLEAGRMIAWRRTSLGSPPQPKPAEVPEIRKLLGLDEFAEAPEPAPDAVTDFLEAKYANEVVQKLDKIVQRASLLDPHEVNAQQIHDQGFHASFEEAHRCYLYGFNRACAVMCRALVESALKDKCDPSHRIESSLRVGQSLFKELLSRAGLEDPLPERAEMIKKYGDFAAHNDPKFVKEYESQDGVRQAVDWTRSILAALYPKAG